MEGRAAAFSPSPPPPGRIQRAPPSSHFLQLRLHRSPAERRGRAAAHPGGCPRLAAGSGTGAPSSAGCCRSRAGCAAGLAVTIPPFPRHFVTVLAFSQSRHREGALGTGPRCAGAGAAPSPVPAPTSPRPPIRAATSRDARRLRVPSHRDPRSLRRSVHTAVAGRGCRNHARHGHARPAPAPGPLSPGEAPGAGPSLPSRCPGISEQLASLRPPHEQRSDPTTLRTVPSGNSRRGRPGIGAQHPSALSLSGPTGPCSRPRSGSPLGWRRTALGSHEAGRPAGFRSHWPRGGARPDRDFWCRDAAPGFGTGRSARAAPTGRSGPGRAAPCPRAGVTERRLQTIPIGTGTAGRDVSPSPRLCSRLGTAR